jgi:hypothetical protein
MVIKELVREVSDKGGSYYGAAYSASRQLFLFACPNLITNSKQFLNDIRKYHYCKDMNTPAYPGSYEKQPAKWIDKYYIIRGSLGKLEEVEIKKRQKKNG